MVGVNPNEGRIRKDPLTRGREPMAAGIHEKSKKTAGLATSQAFIWGRWNIAVHPDAFW